MKVMLLVSFTVSFMASASATAGRENQRSAGGRKASTRLAAGRYPR
jgi:hypothetical protein